MQVQVVTRFLALLLILSLLSAPRWVDETTHNWPQWRGPLATGAAPDADPPVQWSESSNVRWKIELPGAGHSTPIIWEDRLFLTTAVPDGEPFAPRSDDAPGAHHSQPVTQYQRFVLLAVRRSDGQILWQRTATRQIPHEGGHNTGSWASNSPVTDGEHVFAHFGSRGLYAYDLEGTPLWQADLGKKKTLHAHGEGSSPALFGDTLVVNWDHEGSSKVVAFDKTNGRQRWQVERDEVTSWATPVIVEHQGKAQVIVSGTGRIRSYDLETGRVIWECGGMSRNVVATPVVAGGMVFAGSSYNTQSLLAIKLDGASGDITGTEQVLWQRHRGTPYVPSPLLWGDYLYVLRHYQGVLSRLDLKTGEDRGGPFRLGALGNIYASPVAAANRIYISDLQGTTMVLSDAETPELLAVNQLEDSFSASAAVAGRELFLRGRKYLYSLSQPRSEGERKD